MRTLISQLLFFKSPNTYYKWKKEGRPIISLLEKYFTKQDLQEFLQTGQINKFDKLEDFDTYIDRIYYKWFKKYQNLAFREILDFYLAQFSQNYILEDEEGYLLGECVVAKHQNIDSSLNMIELLVSYIIDVKFDEHIAKIIEKHKEVDDNLITLNNHKIRIIYSITNDFTEQELEFILEYKFNINWQFKEEI
ncbi:MAG: hypothetical protein WCY51_07345 [Sulfurimonas sp.]|uniref:hypothetical protein n=1 Tax=Sulfurimonas sp. TaxID=2022749 RepID=UPI0025F8F519|nr:hypothetical protein [Sulfurimonas sp.]MCK9455209.1 hypothetical protein [Sulfurimonas sp.]